MTACRDFVDANKPECQDCALCMLENVDTTSDAYQSDYCASLCPLDGKCDCNGPPPGCTTMADPDCEGCRACRQQQSNTNERRQLTPAWRRAAAVLRRRGRGRRPAAASLRSRRRARARARARAPGSAKDEFYTDDQCMFPNDVYADCAAIDEIDGHDPMMCMEMSCGRCTYTMNRDYEAGAAAGAANGRCMPIDDYDIGGLLGEWNELGCAAYFSDVDLPSTPTDYTESIFADSEYVPAPMCAYALDKCKHGMSCNTIYECSFYFGGNESLYDATSSQYEMEWAACNNNYAPHCDECIRYALCPNVHENKMLPPVVLDLLEVADGHLPKVWPFSVLSHRVAQAEGLEDDEDAWSGFVTTSTPRRAEQRAAPAAPTRAVNYDPNADASCDAAGDVEHAGQVRVQICRL